jgi:hypothetical protein
LPVLEPLVGREVGDGADLGTQVDGGEVVRSIVADEALEGADLLHLGILGSIKPTFYTQL